MEEKIVENKKEDLPSLDLFHSLISIASLIYLSIYLVCVQSTTPLWFTDNTGSCVRFERAILDWPVRSLRKTPVGWHGLQQTKTKEQPLHTSLHLLNLSARGTRWEASQTRTESFSIGVDTKPRNGEHWR